MQPEQYPLMRQEEERHWWYRGNRYIARRLLARWRPVRCEWRLDAGCGTGKNLEALAGFGEPIGIDYMPAALAFSRERGFERLARASVAELPLATASVDVVTCFEVLCHGGVPDWQAAIREYARVLRPGGIVMLREPAFSFLAGSHDRVVHGMRRYRRREFRAAVEAAGLEVVRCSYQNLCTFFPALVIRTWQRWFKREEAAGAHSADFHKGSPALGSLLHAWLAFEGWLLQYVRLPLGSSVLCVARKRA